MSGTIGQIHGALVIVKAIADTVKEMGEAPLSYLYLGVLPAVHTLDNFNKIVALLLDTNLVEKRNDCLIWKGEAQCTPQPQ